MTGDAGLGCKPGHQPPGDSEATSVWFCDIDHLHPDLPAQRLDVIAQDHLPYRVQGP